MSERQPIHDEESVIAALKEGDLELLRAYRIALEERHGDTTAGRYNLEESLIKIYVEAGMFDEALDGVDAMLDMADGERDEVAYERFRMLGAEIISRVPGETPETPRSIN